MFQSRKIILRALLMTVMAWTAIKSATEAHAIADPGTSAGLACNYSCILFFDDCWTNTTLSNEACFEAKDLCYWNCDTFGTPVFWWWIF